MTAMIGTIVYALESPSDGAVTVASIWDNQRVRSAFPGYEFPGVRAGVLRDASIQALLEYTEMHRRDDAYLRWVQALLNSVR